MIVTVGGMRRKNTGDEGRTSQDTLLLQEHCTFHEELAQIHGQILARKSLLRTKANSHSPAQAPSRRRAAPASFNFSTALCHTQEHLVRLCSGSIQTASCLQAAGKEHASTLNCRHETAPVNCCSTGPRLEESPGQRSAFKG